ncbi:TetR/AcrR family transcriptional regulator [Arthrobacter agilis]|uniref:TetR/AcrR family transcriptional regulator n=1 Tax=Arthrobacter agilis TaxID=37921 RepID=UPI002785214F|nr:TetR/AcrR family transcriptional regulator [Arthrobacter agilis]MDQ0736835.1 AcrR family transcriptional regulator [Arthrobacter agilis]
MIIAAVIPLLLERGRDVTSKQIAEAAGIAEGTIFRAFGDKESLIAAAVDRYFDPLELHEALRGIDPALPLEDKLRAILLLMTERFQGAIRMMAAIGGERPATAGDERHEFAQLIGQLLELHDDQLNIPPERVAHFIRLIAFATAIPQFSESLDFSVDELVMLLKQGIAGRATAERN